MPRAAMRASATTFNRLVDAHHDGGCCRYKEIHEQQQHDPTHCSARPFGTIEHPMIVLKLLLVRVPHDAQDGCHCSFSWGQDGSDQEHFGPFPHAFAEDTFKRAQHLYNLCRQIKHLSSLFFAVRFERSLLCLPFFVQSIWIKSSSG